LREYIIYRTKNTESPERSDRSLFHDMRVLFLMSEFSWRTDTKGVDWTILVGFDKSGPCSLNLFEQRLREKYPSSPSEELPGPMIQSSLISKLNYPYWIPAFDTMVSKRLANGTGFFMDEETDFIPLCLRCVLDEYARNYERLGQQAFIGDHYSHHKELSEMNTEELNTLYSMALKAKIFSEVPGMRKDKTEFIRIVSTSENPTVLPPCRFFLLSMSMDQETYRRINEFKDINRVKLLTRVVFRIYMRICLVLLEFQSDMDIIRLKQEFRSMYGGAPLQVNFIRPMYYPSIELDPVVYYMMSMTTRIETDPGGDFASEAVIAAAARQFKNMLKFFTKKVSFNFISDEMRRVSMDEELKRGGAQRRVQTLSAASRRAQAQFEAGIRSRIQSMPYSQNVGSSLSQAQAQAPSSPMITRSVSYDSIDVVRCPRITTSSQVNNICQPLTIGSPSPFRQMTLPYLSTTAAMVISTPAPMDRTVNFSGVAYPGNNGKNVKLPASIQRTVDFAAVAYPRSEPTVVTAVAYPVTDPRILLNRSYTVVEAVLEPVMKPVEKPTVEPVSIPTVSDKL